MKSPPPIKHKKNLSSAPQLNRLKRIKNRTGVEYCTSPSERELTISQAIHPIKIQAICIYPHLAAGNLARHWMETALHSITPHANTQIEYFSYALLSEECISWESVSQHAQHKIILIVGDGGQPLEPRFRHALHELITHHHGDHSLVLFRDLDPEPSLNTQTILNYLAALAHRNHCELHAMNGNGHPIDCYRHSGLIPRKHYRE